MHFNHQKLCTYTFQLLIPVIFDDYDLQLMKTVSFYESYNITLDEKQILERDLTVLILHKDGKSQSLWIKRFAVQTELN